MTRLFALSTLLFAMVGTDTSAQGNFTFGLAVQADQNPYVGAKDEAELVPYLSYENGGLEITLDGINYDIDSSDALTFGVGLGYRSVPDFPTGDALFTGLDRDDAIEAELTSQYSFGDAYASLDVQSDVSGTHNGTQARFTVGYELEFDRVAFDFSAGALFRDAKLNNHLYGVTTAEATGTRAAFDAGDTTTAFVEVQMLYAFTDQVFGVAQVSFEDLGSNANSPLVARSEIAELTLGVAYEF